MTPAAPLSPATPEQKTPWQTGLVWIGSVVLVASTVGALALLAWWKLREFEAAANAGGPPAHPTFVGITEVGELKWRNSTTAIGTVLVPQSITLNNELPGTVTEVLFEPGGIVEEGAVLVRLDTSVEQAQLDAALAREKFAESTLRRNRQLAGSEAITELELEQLESEWSQARSQVAELRAVIARKTITAPFRARVGLTELAKGQYLPAGTLIASLQGINDHLHVDFMLPQGTAAQVEVGQEVELSAAGTTWTARLMAIDAQADRSTRNVRARVRLPDPPVRLLPGDSVQVRIAYGPEIVLPAVPAEAIRRSPQGAFVFVAEETAAGTLIADERPVIPATQVGARVGIAAGVRSGDRVVVEGSFKLRDGALIAPAGGDGQPPSGAGPDGTSSGESEPPLNTGEPSR